MSRHFLLNFFPPCTSGFGSQNAGHSLLGCLLFCLFLFLPAPAQAEHAGHRHQVIGAGIPPAYDPLAGVDPNGRITRVELPESVTNPERWRYIPEGRLKPGNLLDRFLVSTFILPVLFFEEDVGAGGGFALTDIDFLNSRRRDHVILKASYTTEGQQRYFGHWLRWLNHLEVPSGGVAFEERSSVSVIVDYEKTLTRRFFGLGAGTKEANETSYADRVALAEVTMEGIPWVKLPNLVGRTGIRLESHEISDGFISSVPVTATDFAGDLCRFPQKETIVAPVKRRIAAIARPAVRVV